MLLNLTVAALDAPVPAPETAADKEAKSLQSQLAGDKLLTSADTSGKAEQHC